MAELLVNYDFNDGSSGWTASGGFGTYSYTSSNQIAVLDGIAYFTYVSRTLSQIVSVSDSIENVDNFVCVLNIKHRQKNDDGGYTQVDTYNFEVLFKDSSNNTMITKRTPSTGSAVVTENLLLHYNTFNTASYNGSGVTITDISGNSRNGTITGSPNWTSNYFTFTDDYITTPNLSSKITSANEVHSVELWVYPTDNGVLVQYNNSTSPNTGYHASSIEIVGGNLEVGLWNGSAVGSTGNIGAVSFNQWHQIVLTYNGSVCKGYIDGIYKGSVNVSWDSPMNQSFPFYMNFGFADFTSQGDGTNFDGRFGIMRVYNKALTDAEVLSNYNSTVSTIDFTDVELRLERSEIPETFNNISSIEVRVTGIDTDFWNGNHGPMVDYISLQAEEVMPPHVTEGLILYYDPNNTSSYSGTGTILNDLSGNNLTGALSNVSYDSPAFVFNGSSATISTPDNALLEPESGDWTIEIWVNYSTFNVSNCLMSKTNGGSASDWGYGIRTSPIGSTYMEVANGITSINSPSYVVSTNTWYQIVGVWTNVATNSIEFYVNGISQGSNSHSFAGIKNTTRPLSIGSFDGGGVFGQWINGKVGIVRLYSRALTSAQVTQNFDADKSKYLSPTPSPTPDQAPNFQSNKIKQNHGKLTRGIYKRFWNIYRDIRNL